MSEATVQETSAPKRRKQNRKATVSVVQSVTTAIQVGRDNYLVKATEDGRGVRVENSQGSIFLPFGEGGKAILESLTATMGANVARKRRRTKAEILASKESV